MSVPSLPPLGAHRLPDGSCRFTVWAPSPTAIELCVDGRDPVPLRRDLRGYATEVVGRAGAGTRYGYLIDGDGPLPDPASRHQPDGVHGLSAVVDTKFGWTDGGWPGVAVDDLVIYELHVGAFSDEGTFDAAIPYLADLADLGVSAIELMPVNQFPGRWNWGYDGVGLYAPQDTYGGPQGLQRLVDAAHREGLGVILDVVYNHLGPEGNYLPRFGPYLNPNSRTPWGDAVNLDAAGSDEVRRFFVDNATGWVELFHIDGLRLDAVHAFVDGSAWRFVDELTAEVHAAGRRRHVPALVIAEDAWNDSRLTAPPDTGGGGLDGQWNDDFHHALHVALTGDQHGYYSDFTAGDVATAITSGYVYTGQHAPYRGHRLGTPARVADPRRLVVFSQNHDQVGNTPEGRRLHTRIEVDRAKVAAALVLLGPGIPLLFMGEEFASPAPFPYFVDHTDTDLREAVRQGRMEEMRSYHLDSEPVDPLEAGTFDSATLERSVAESGAGKEIIDWYRALLALRRNAVVPALVAGEVVHAEAIEGGVVVRVGDGFVLVASWAAPVALDGVVAGGMALAAYSGPGEPVGEVGCGHAAVFTTGPQN